MSTISKPRLKTYKAEGVIRPFRFVKFGTAEGQMLECDANEKAIGVFQGSVALAANDFGEVALPGGGGLIQISETVTRGKRLTPTADGEGEVVDAAGEEYGAVAYQDGSANDVIYAEICTSTESVASDA